MTNIEYLQDFIGTAIESLKGVQAKGVKNEYSFDINCSDLEDFNFIDIRQAEKFKKIFDRLKEMNGPALYRFEIISDTEGLRVIEALNSYKASTERKATPALKSKIDHSSKILYVGKVKGFFWGRLIQHLGFFKVKATQGLQLFYWAKGLPLHLRVNVLEFDSNMAELMSVLEYSLAQKLNPLIGKHK
ncbi:hypothetical protein [Chitinophaga sp. GbtcB8]|uniref:hypothetical protein n=1 Tax=Chitinophaga sp. GbtcB8 TaxID=2824753 RepID=UPI001C2F1A33|nr:hypothetical protein [Chitinophaga sp. GbtcB8]